MTPLSHESSLSYIKNLDLSIITDSDLIQEDEAQNLVDLNYPIVDSRIRESSRFSPFTIEGFEAPVVGFPSSP